MSMDLTPIVAINESPQSTKKTFEQVNSLQVALSPQKFSSSVILRDRTIIAGEQTRERSRNVDVESLDIVDDEDPLQEETSQSGLVQPPVLTADQSQNKPKTLQIVETYPIVIAPAPENTTLRRFRSFDDFSIDSYASSSVQSSSSSDDNNGGVSEEDKSSDEE